MLLPSGDDTPVITHNDADFALRPVVRARQKEDVARQTVHADQYKESGLCIRRLWQVSFLSFLCFLTFPMCFSLFFTFFVFGT